jgi:hypothetical protein
VLLLSPTIQHWLGIAILHFEGYRYPLFGLPPLEAVPAPVPAAVLFERFNAGESPSSITLILGSNGPARLRRLVGFLPINGNGDHRSRWHV